MNRNGFRDFGRFRPMGAHEQERADIFHKKHMENLGYGAHYVGDRQFLTKVTEARKRKTRVFKQTKK